MIKKTLAFLMGIGGIILFFIAIGAGVVYVLFSIIRSFLGVKMAL